MILGQEVFYRYGGATLTGLAYQSLLGGMGANRVVEVLARTGGFGVKVARHRLFETTQHVLECTKSLESIQPGGAGFASSIRVRLLHAAVRQRILKLEQSRPGYYNVEEFGIPINDHDCIATIGTFSATIVWLSLPRQGLFLRRQEIEDYIALWRLIAHYTGTPTDPFETPEKAKAIMESIVMREIQPSQTSKLLAGNIIKCLEAQPPAYASRSFLEVNARWLNGNELSDALGLGQPSIYYWALMGGQCLFFMALCYFYRSFRSLDQRKIAVSQHSHVGSPAYPLHLSLPINMFVCRPSANSFGPSSSKENTGSEKRPSLTSNTYLTSMSRPKPEAMKKVELGLENVVSRGEICKLYSVVLLVVGRASTAAFCWLRVF